MVRGEVAPGLPTSGQILGILVRSLGITHPDLGDKTSQRYFSGRLNNRVKETSRAKIIAAISQTLVASVFAASPAQEHEDWVNSSRIAAMLDWHAVNWDRFRAFLLPRAPLVYSRHLAPVWQVNVRLAAIDLSLRAAAYIHITGASPEALEFLNWTGDTRRGDYLNRKRQEAGVSVNGFAESTGVSVTAVEGWLYEGVRPADDNLVGIAEALSSDVGPRERDRLLRELRRLYWASDIAGTLAGFIGDEAVDDIMGRLCRYATLLCDVIDEKINAAVRFEVLDSLAVMGAFSEFSGNLLAALVPGESDEEWKEDLKSAASDWARRVLATNLDVHQTEVDELIRTTEGRLLKDWDISNPEAYAHYRRFGELQLQGRIHEAVAELEMAARLDPLDPANQFTLGSMKGGMGAKLGNASMVEEGLAACWVAAKLDGTWVLPWAEIGWILLESGKVTEAVGHLKAIAPERNPLDVRYYTAMGSALRELGQFEESLKAFEASIELNPGDPLVVAAAAMAAEFAGDRTKSNRYARMARHLGVPKGFNLFLQIVNAWRNAGPPEKSAGGRSHDMAVLDASIRLTPDDATLYLQRARTHFLKEDNERTLSDLDEALRIEPDHADAYYMRGTVYGHLRQFDRVVSDMTEVLRIEPETSQARYHRGLAYGELDELDRAIEDLTEAIRLEPDNADAYRGRGDCLRFKGEYDEAIADFDTGLELDPEDASSYRGRGAAYRMKGELDRALADYDEAVRLDPGDFYARRFRGDAHLAMGEYDLAMADCEAALAIGGPDEAAYFFMGQASLFSGSFDRAIRNFDSAVECNLGSCRAYYGRALAKELVGDFDWAEFDYRRSRQLGYGDPR